MKTTEAARLAGPNHEPIPTTKKVWIKPDIEEIGIESGNSPYGHEGAHTILYNGATFTGVYTS